MNFKPTLWKIVLSIVLGIVFGILIKQIGLYLCELNEIPNPEIQDGCGFGFFYYPNLFLSIYSIIPIIAIYIIWSFIQKKQTSKK